MERAAIFVGMKDAEEKVALCREACTVNGWAAPSDRVAILDPDHPNQGLPFVLFTSSSAPVSVLVIPDWEDLVQGLVGSVYQVSPQMKGQNARVMATGIETAHAFFQALGRDNMLLHVVSEGKSFEPGEFTALLEAAQGPLMESAAEWDAELRRAIRAGQDRAWAEGRRVGRPPQRTRRDAQ